MKKKSVRKSRRVPISQHLRRSKARSSLRSKSIRKSRKPYFHPDDPKKSFDVYIDKDPSDTISIKYTTLEDVKSTIRKLERLYKSKKFSHKRIWQVGMIMYVRLRALKDKKPLQYKLSKRYFTFLGKRTKMDQDDRYNSKFIIDI